MHGEKIFNSFEDDFLRADIEKHLIVSLFNPIHWFGPKGRTERAIEYYQKVLFHGATFADLLQTSRPMIVINTSDLGYGVRFSFIQDYFGFLCSDLSSFSVARAVAASSAVPVIFNPVVVENYADCGGHGFSWPADAAERAKQDADFGMLYEGLRSYSDKRNRKYIHFVDGGITDNLGLQAMSDVIAVSGGPAALLSKLRKKAPSHVVFLSVNASTEKADVMDESTREPSALAAMNAMTDVQLHRYNAATVERVKNELTAWAAEMSTPAHPVTPHFIQIGFEDASQPQLKLFLNKIPTSFSLTNEQVDILIKSARSILQADPEYKQFLAELEDR